MHSTRPRSWTTCEYHLAMARRHSAETVKVSTASVSTTSIGSVSDGRKWGPVEVEVVDYH